VSLGKKEKPEEPERLRTAGEGAGAAGGAACAIL